MNFHLGENQASGGSAAVTEQGHPAMRRPTVIDGLGALGFGFRFLIRSPRTWPLAWVPAVIFIALFFATTALSVFVIRPMLTDGLGSILGWVGAIAAGLVGVLLSLALTPPLAAPALEGIVSQVEHSLGIAERRPIGFWAELGLGLRSAALVACLAVPLLGILTLANLILPGAQFVTIPLKLLVASAALAWNLFDYPLTLRGFPLRQRLRVLRRNKASVLSFGASFAVLFWLPCFPILMLPVGVAAATRLIWQILEAEGVPPTAPSVEGDADLPA